MSDAAPQVPGIEVRWSDAQRRALLWLVVAAVLWRWLLTARTPVPGDDGVTYLWMARCFATGDAARALAEPFSPLWPLLIAAPTALGVEPWLAARVLACLCGGLAIVPIAATAERLRPGALLPAAALAATSRVFALTSADVLTEPLFVLVAAVAVHAAVVGRAFRCALCCGLAFWVRPEGALLLALLPLLCDRRRATIGVILGAGAIAAFGLWRLWCGHGFDPVPKLAFHGARDDLGAERGDLLGNAIRVPTTFMEAFLFAGALAALSLWPQGADEPPPRRTRVGLWIVLLLGMGAIVAFVVRRRFFVAWAPIVVPFAGVAVARMSRLGERGRELLLGLACSLDLWTAWHGTTPPDRVADRVVGEFLGDRLLPGEQVVADLPRVLWFAGRPPMPPRHLDAPALVAAAKRPEVAYVVLLENTARGTFSATAEGLAADFVRLELPAPFADLAHRRGIAVFARR